MSEFDRNDELMEKGSLIFGAYAHKNPDPDFYDGEIPALSLHIGYDEKLKDDFILSISTAFVMSFLPQYEMNLEKFRKHINNVIDTAIEHPIPSQIPRLKKEIEELEKSK